MLSELLDSHPLPPGWALPEHFTETILVGSSVVELSGLLVVSPIGEQITGSAASVSSSASATARSYFELLERVSVVTAMSDRTRDYELRDRLGRSAGHVSRCELFAESPEPDRWRPSRSNGVALHVTWQEACDRAAAELVERDRVLRSWYGESVPRPCELPEAMIPAGLQSLASWMAYELETGGCGVRSALTVVCVVGVPKIDTTPLAYGFAARPTRLQAIEAAASEAVQRFGFLFGEAIPQVPPSSAPTPDFHQEFFLCPSSHAVLYKWLRGISRSEERPLEKHLPQKRQRQLEKSDEVFFVDVTPKHLGRLLFVAKAICPSAEPLVFGQPAPHRADCNPAMRVHPIA